MNFDEYIKIQKPTLAAHFLLKRLLLDHPNITPPYPPAEFTETEVETIRCLLDNSLPVNSMMMDLWDISSTPDLLNMLEGSGLLLKTHLFWPLEPFFGAENGR